MKLTSSSLHIALGVLALATAVGLGCGTRTSIGQVADAGDAGAGDSSQSTGTGGATATGGTTATGGIIGASGTGGGIVTSGEGGAIAKGGHTGASGGNPGANGGGPAGGAVTGGGGGAGGMVACAPISPPTQGGPGGNFNPQCWTIFYPASGFYGDNILADGCTKFTSGIDYEIAAQQTMNIPVQITITSLSISGTRSGFGGASGIPIATSDPGWYYGSDGDWRAKTYDATTGQQFFQTRALSDNETEFQFDGTGSARVDIYDCDPNTPTRSKIISWSP